MNLPDSLNKITTDYAHKVADYEDSVVYRYLTGQIEALKAKGEDITKYEIIFVANDHPVRTKDGFRIEKTVRLHKINTPV